MIDPLLICTDLDRTLIPNGPQPESPMARPLFDLLVARPEITLAYVTGRHRALVEEAILEYDLPIPDYVVGDVGTTLYRVGSGDDWQRLTFWESEIAVDWGGKDRGALEALLVDLAELQLQERTKQNDYKLSYYVPIHQERDALSVLIQHRLASIGVKANLIWSIDEPKGVGLLDILPARASKLHAIEALMRRQGFDETHTVFCGDSGNDLEVLASALPAVLVANSDPEVRQLSARLAAENHHSDQLYLAQGGFLGLNGNYSGGILEGIAHYHPELRDWLAQQLSGANP